MEFQFFFDDYERWRGSTCWTYISGQIITTSAEVTLNGGLIRELPQNPRNIQV